MIIAKPLWDKNIIGNMKNIIVEDKSLKTYTEMPKSVYQSLQFTAIKFPEKIAFVDDDLREYNYLQFLNMVNKFSRKLMVEHDIGKHDHVGILMYCNLDFCIAYYSISALNAVCVPLPTKYREKELQILIDKSNLKLLLLDEKFDLCFLTNIKLVFNQSNKRLIDSNLNLYSGEDIVRDILFEDKTIIMFTSGTTSNSKGVVLNNINIMHAVETYRKTLEITCKDRILIPVPIYHVTGLIGLLSLGVCSGATVFLHSRYNAERILKTVNKSKITFMHGSPTVFNKLLELKDSYKKLESLRLLLCGSSYMPQEKMKEFYQWLPKTSFQVVYGMTETASPALLCPQNSYTSKYPKSSGKPIPGLELVIKNNEGKKLPANVRGNLFIKGTNVTFGYYNNPVKDLLVDGWLDTGDIAYYNDDGYFFVVDRKKDMINRGGEKVWSQDIEELILELDYIDECAVVSKEDEVYGEVPVAVIKIKGNFFPGLDEIKKYLLINLATFQVPVEIRVVDEIYKTKGLKVDKKRISKLFEIKEELDA